MKQPKKPARWQLDLFVLAMIGLLLLIMRAQLSPGWEQVVDGVWSVVTLGGMGLWAWLNNDALNNEKRERRLRRAKGTGSPASRLALRDIPLTRVQRHFLAATQRPDHNTDRDQAHHETRPSRPSH
jgi:hypothetical protein